MSWVPAERVLATVAAQKQVLAEQAERIAAADARHAAERQRVHEEYQQACHDLGQALLAKVEQPAIALAAEQTGLVGLVNENVPAKRDARRVWLAQRLQQIANDPRYANAELLRHPRTGSLTTAIAEATDYRRTAAGVVETCESHLRFGRLYEIGYGTDAHEFSWWRYSHWADRSAANEIVAMFPGKTDFSQVRADYDTAKQTVATYDAELARLHGEVKAGEALEAEYRTLYDEYQTLDQRALDHTRGRLVQHLLTSDASLVSQRLLGWPSLRLLFLRASGLQAKIGYLDGIHKKNVGDLRGELETQFVRLDTIEQRTRKRWAPMPMDKFQKLAEDRRARYDKRWQRYDKVYVSVRSFDKWDRARRFEDLLWWDLMTRGRYDGSYINDVFMFHRTHPTYSFDADDMKGSDRDFFGDELANIVGDRDAQDRSDDFDTTDAQDRSDDADAAAISIDTDRAGDERGGDDLQSTDAS